MPMPRGLFIVFVTRRSILGSDGMTKSDCSHAPCVLLKRPLLSAFWVLSECLLNSLMLSECADVSDLIIRFLQWSWARINICFSHYFLKYAGLLSSVQYLVTSDAMSPGSPARARRLLVTTSGPASVLTLTLLRPEAVSVGAEATGAGA